jgi:hypothetical protein
MWDTAYMRGSLNRRKPFDDTTASGNQGVIVTESNLASHEAQLGQFLSKQSDLHFYQTLDWYRCCVPEQDLFFVLTLSDNNILASSLVRRRPLPGLTLAIYRIERGPVVTNMSVLAEHLEHVINAVSKDAVLVAVSPFRHGEPVQRLTHDLVACGFTPSPRSLAPYETTIAIDLSLSIDQLRAGLRRSLKTQLNRGSRLGVEVRRATDIESFDLFVTQHNDMAHRRGLAPIQPEIARHLGEFCTQPEGSVQLFIASHEGKQVAGICLLSSGNRVIYEWGVSSEAIEHRQFPLTHMLHWNAVQWAKQAGYDYYDFGGYWDERGDADPINRFKTGFSKDKQHFVPEHVLGVRPLLAKAYHDAAQLRAGLFS